MVVGTEIHYREKNESRTVMSIRNLSLMTAMTPDYIKCLLIFFLSHKSFTVFC